MSYVMLPPEINSGRMYTGPGAGPMLAAATAWDNLAAELYSTAEQYGSVVSGLNGESWSGPAAARMVSAAAPHVHWLTTTAGQAQLTGAQAKAAASAYAQAFAMTVPPPLIAANRAQYLHLVATNIFGQNAPAIATTEAQYGEYWAQDGEAMDGYAANSAAATQSVAAQQFSPMMQTSDGGMSQTAATGAAQAQSLYSAGQNLMPAVQQALGAMANPAQATTGSLSTIINDFFNLFNLPPGLSNLLSLTNVAAGNLSGFFTVPGILATIWAVGGIQWAIIGGTAASAASVVAAPAALMDAVAPIEGAALPTATLASASAQVGEASVVGGLSVPPNWVDTAPALRVATAALPTTSLGGGSGLMGGGMPLFSGAPLAATVAGRGVGGSFSGNRRQQDTRNRRASNGNDRPPR